MRVLRLVRLLVSLAVLATPVGLYASRASAQAAASPESLQAANELFELLSKDMFEQMTAQMSAQFWPLIEGQLRGKADAAALADLRKEFEKIQLENLGDVLKARSFHEPQCGVDDGFRRKPVCRPVFEAKDVTGEVKGADLATAVGEELIASDRTIDHLIDIFGAFGLPEYLDSFSVLELAQAAAGAAEFTEFSEWPRLGSWVSVDVDKHDTPLG